MILTWELLLLSIVLLPFKKANLGGTCFLFLFSISLHGKVSVWMVVSCLCDAPFPGSVDYPSTRGIQVDVGLPDATSENRVESPLYGELYPNTIPALNLSQAVKYNHNDTNMDKNGLLGPYYNIHKTYQQCPIVTRVKVSLLYNTY